MADKQPFKKKAYGLSTIRLLYDKGKNYERFNEVGVTLNLQD